MLLNRGWTALAASACLLGLAALAAQGQDREPAKSPPRARNRIDVPSSFAGVLIVVGSDAGTLKEGDEVKQGQLLARTDDRLARIDLEISEAKVEIARAEARAASKTREEAKNRYEAMERARKIGHSVSEDDFRAARLTLDRYVAEEQVKTAAVRVAELETKKAAVKLEMHQIRSPVSGTIRAIYRNRGEAVKSLEPIMQIEIADPAK